MAPGSNEMGLERGIAAEGVRGGDFQDHHCAAIRRYVDAPRSAPVSSVSFPNP